MSVAARPVDGQATEAVAEALAEAFGVPSRQVRLVSGLRSRDKIFDVIAPEAETRLGQLLATG